MMKKKLRELLIRYKLIREKEKLYRYRVCKETIVNRDRINNPFSCFIPVNIPDKEDFYYLQERDFSGKYTFIRQFVSPQEMHYLMYNSIETEDIDKKIYEF